MSKFEDLKQRLVDEIQIDDSKSREENVKKITIVASGLAGVIATQPIPFADLPILTFIEIVMVNRIGEAYGYKFSMDRSKEVLMEIGAVVGMGFLAQNAIIAGYKTFIPFAGGVFTIPLVFGACFAIGKVADYYYQCKYNEIPFDKDIAKKLFKQFKKQGEELGKDEENLKDFEV